MTHPQTREDAAAAQQQRESALKEAEAAWRTGLVRGKKPSASDRKREDKRVQATVELPRRPNAPIHETPTKRRKTVCNSWPQVRGNVLLTEMDARGQAEPDAEGLATIQALFLGLFYRC